MHTLVIPELYSRFDEFEVCCIIRDKYKHYQFMGEVNFSEAMIALKYWKALEESDALALNEIDCCKNVFASFRE